MRAFFFFHHSTQIRVFSKGFVRAVQIFLELVLLDHGTESVFPGFEIGLSVYVLGTTCKRYIHLYLGILNVTSVARNCISLLQIFVLAVTLIREAVDDFRRHQRDEEVNSQKYMKIFKSRDMTVSSELVPSSKLKVGDLVSHELEAALFEVLVKFFDCIVRTVVSPMLVFQICELKI